MSTHNNASRDKLDILNNALKNLNQKIRNNMILDSSDKLWVNSLSDCFGRHFIELADLTDVTKNKRYNCMITINRINGANQHESLKNLSILQKTLQTLVYAIEYTPKVVLLNGVPITVHNKKIATMLKERYTTEEFKNIFNYLEQQDVFTSVVDEQTGFIKTSSIDQSENPEMVRQWITDSIRCNELNLYFGRNNLYKKCINSIIKFYNTPTEKSILFQIISGKIEYDNKADKNYLLNGVAHVFSPHTLSRDLSWFNNKRLESHGLALGAICRNILEGLIENKDYGYKYKELEDNHYNTIILLAHFFYKIKFYKAPSAGNWEETPFDGGLTWDTTAITESLILLKSILFDIQSNKQVTEFRKDIQYKERILAKELSLASDSLLFQTVDNLSIIIQKGIQRIRKTYLAEAPNIREVDASLVFITHSSITLDCNKLEDALKHLEILGLLENKLLRDNGIIRYEPFYVSECENKVISSDSYLNLNYNIAVDRDGYLNLTWGDYLEQFGSKDCSSTQMFIARSKLTNKDTEAEWFMVSDMSTGYGLQLRKLINLYKLCKFNKQKSILETIIGKVFIKETEYINRAYARITDCDKVLKANGVKGLSFAIPEAYQHVTLITKQENKILSTAIPGINTPLAWAQASLLKACMVYERNLIELHNLGLDKAGDPNR